MRNNSQFLRSQQPTGAAIVRLACGTVLLGLLFWVWYSWAADYGYAAVSGTYTFDDNGEHSTLVLLESRVFQQEISHAGIVKQAEGTWRRTGEGGVVFSKEFLKLAGQRVRPDGQADGEVRKTFGGLYLSIVFNGDKGGPVFRKILGDLKRSSAALPYISCEGGYGPQVVAKASLDALWATPMVGAELFGAVPPFPLHEARVLETPPSQRLRS